MSERKVLNKYYPPDFDPSKIPKLKQTKTRQYTIRTMAPFNMRCKTCADYIYKGRKFNAKCEVAEGENFLGLRIYRFYIRCPKCISEIMFKTDPENTDYTLEHGATRLFEAVKLIEQAEKREELQREEDSTNPMKMLETRTKDSKLEMDIMENLEELRELNTRKDEVDYTEVLRRKAEEDEDRLIRQEQEDEDEIRKIFGRTGQESLKRLQDDDDDDGEEEEASSSMSSERTRRKASDFLLEGGPPAKKTKSLRSDKHSMSNLVKRKNPPPETSSAASSAGTSGRGLVPYVDEDINSSSGNIIVRDDGPPSESDDETNVTSPATVGKPDDGASAKPPVTDAGVGVDASEPETCTANEDETEARLSASIREGMSRNVEKSTRRDSMRGGSFGLLVGYGGSDDSDLSSEGDGN